MAVIPGFKTTYDVIKPGNGSLVAKGSKVTVHATVRPIPWLLLQSDRWLLLQSDRWPWVLSSALTICCATGHREGDDEEVLVHQGLRPEALQLPGTSAVSRIR